MLARGKLGNPVIGRGCGAFSMYANGKSPDPPFQPPLMVAPGGPRPYVP